ncbi:MULTISPECIES: LEA type 2 family protein [Halostella]|uniref:LEA type 2 family protein n=1 Tax=Halostella TaxID=1843185 RepID=UPI0019633108|nr:MULTISPECIES: LEA type 2 family protein [Halostella]
MDGERIRSGLLGSKLRVAATTLGVIGLAVGAAVAAGLLGVPSVESVDNEFGEVDETTTVIVTDLAVDNPNPFGTGFLGASAEYTVRMNGVPMANGSKEDLDLDPGRNDVRLRTHMDNRRIPDWWVTHVRNGERTEVAIDARIRSDAVGRSVPVERTETINTSMIERFDSNETRPVEADSRVFDDPMLYVNETRGEWGTVTAEETPMDATFVAYNPKSVPYVVTEMRYEITMNGVVVGEGTSGREYVIEPRSSETIEARTAIRNERLDDWWVTHLRNDEVTTLRIEFAATVEAEDPTSLTGRTLSLRLPMNELTHEETIETDILGSENGSAGGNGTASKNVTAAAAAR